MKRPDTDTAEGLRQFAEWGAWCNRMCEELPTRTGAAGFGRGTCILHTKLAVLQAKRDGIPARPLTCQVSVVNAAMNAIAERLGRAPEPHEWSDEAWGLGIGYGKDPGSKGYDGHVVLVVGEMLLLDLTLDQASRPLKDIHLRPGYFGPVPERFLRGKTTVAFTMNDSLVQYTALPKDRAFRNAPDWRMVTPDDALTRGLLGA